MKNMWKIVFFVFSTFLQCFYGGEIPVKKIEKFDETIPESSEKTQMETLDVDIMNVINELEKRTLDQSNDTQDANASSLDKIYNEDDIESIIFDNFNKTKESYNNISTLEKESKAHETEIYESGDAKANNLTERSFIWLNTRYVKPLKSKVYNHSLNELKLNRKLRPTERFHIFNKALSRNKQEMPFAPPPYLFPLAQVQRKPHTPKSKTPKPMFTPSHDYTKTPCNMPGHFTIDKKINMKCIPVMSKPAMYETFRQQLPFIMPHYKNAINNINNPAEIKPILSKSKFYMVEPQKASRQNYMAPVTKQKVKDYYGIPNTHQLHRPSFTINEPNNKAEESINYESNLFSDNNYILSPVDVMTDDEDKLLERFIKNTLADNGIHLDEDLNKKCPECERKNDTKCVCKVDSKDLKNKLYNYIEKKGGHIEMGSKKLEPGIKMDYDDPLLVDTDQVLNKTFSDDFFSLIK